MQYHLAGIDRNQWPEWPGKRSRAVGASHRQLEGVLDEPQSKVIVLAVGVKERDKVRIGRNVVEL